MFQLTTPQATFLAAALVLLGGLSAYFGRGFAFLLKRWWTGAPKQEQAAYFNSVADLLAKLKANDTTIENLHRFDVILRNPTFASGPVAVKAVEDMVEAPEPEGDEEPRAFQSNAAMKARAGAALIVAESHLNQAVMDLRLLLNEKEEEALNATQRHWEDYCGSLSTLAWLEFEGGTHAPLAGTLAKLAETERRTAEVRTHVKERGAS